MLPRRLERPLVSTPFYGQKAETYFPSRSVTLQAAAGAGVRVVHHDHFTTQGVGNDTWACVTTGHTRSVDLNHVAFGGGYKALRQTGGEVDEVAGCMKLTRAAVNAKDADLTMTFTTAQNWLGKHFCVDLYLDDATKQHFQTLTVLFYGPDAATYIIHQGFSRIYAGSPPGTNPRTWGSGYVSFPFRANREAGMAAVKKIIIRLTNVAADLECDQYLCRIRFIDPIDAAVRPLLLRADGGYANHDTLLTAATALGLRFVVNVFPDKIGASGYMTLAQCLTHQGNHHLINCHDSENLTVGTDGSGWSSPNRTTDRIVDEVARCQQWLFDNGLYSGLGTHVTLGGDYRDELGRALEQQLYWIGLTGTHRCIPGCATRLGSGGDTNAFTGDAATRMGKAQTAITDAITYGTYPEITFHALTGDFTTDDAATFMAWMMARGDLVNVLPAELIAGERTGRWYAPQA